MVARLLRIYRNHRKYRINRKYRISRKLRRKVTATRVIDLAVGGDGGVGQVERALTGEIGHGLELLLPVLGDPDGLALVGLAGGGHPLLVGVGHDLRQVLRVDCVEHIKEVVPRWTLILGVGGGEILGELTILLEVWPEAAHRELVVVGHLDELDLGLLQEMLFAGEDVLEEIFVDDGLVGEVHLD